MTVSEHLPKCRGFVLVRTFRAVVATCALVVGAACGPAPESEFKPHDVLIVTVDTARADRFSYAGPSPVTTSATDLVAAEGVAFLTAVAPSPITLVSHASLLTGQDPITHGVRNNGDFALAPEAVTLAEILGREGWATAAFIGASVLDSRYGLDQGFDVYDDEISGDDAAGMFAYPRRSGDEVVSAALQWLDAASPEDRTFVWVHLYDPHAPYVPPEPERSRYPESPYDGAVAYADRMIGRLLDGYRKHHRYERALAVITSDHGESLGEHGEQTHGVFVYDATVRIPLVVRGPGVVPGARVAGPVGLIDILPTILALVGAEIPSQVDGRNLEPVLRGAAPADSERAMYVESLLPWLNYGWSPLRGLRTARWKFVRGSGVELYDLAEDPDERHDLVHVRTDIAEQLSLELAAVLEGECSATADRLVVDEAERSRLAALGYVDFAGGAVTDDSVELPDPRQRIKVMERMYDAMTRFAEGDAGSAIADLEAMVSEEPDNFSAWASLAELRFRVGDYEGAADGWGRAARSAPNNPRFAELEGLALERLGSLEEALAACDRALALDPSRSSSREFRWRLLARLERDSELVAELERTVVDDPENGMARLLLIQASLGREPSPELVQALGKALEDLPGDLALTAGLAAAVHGTGDVVRAEELYRQVLAERPGDLTAALMVGGRALTAGDVQEARRVLEAGVRKNPDREAMQVMVARARMADRDFAGARDALVRAYRLAPGWAETWLAAGELGILEGLPEQAAANLDRAATAADEDVDFWQRLAEANRRLGREREAAIAERRAAGDR